MPPVTFWTKIPKSSHCESPAISAGFTRFSMDFYCAFIAPSYYYEYVAKLVCQYILCDMYVLCSCSCVKPRMKAEVTVQWFWTLRCITVATFFDRELTLTVLYVCFCLLLLLVLVLLPFLNLQAQIRNIFLFLIGIFSFFLLEYFPFSNWKWYFVTIIVLTYCEKKLF